MEFINLVNKHFSFLEYTYHFGIKIINDSSVEYKTSGLDILIGWHKGEVDIDFYVREETAILKPHRSRMFRLYKVAVSLDKNALVNAPRSPNYITSIEDCDRELGFAAKIMKSYCDDILKGNLQLLEKMASQ